MSAHDTHPAGPATRADDVFTAPAELTAFVGRRAELVAARQALVEHRLVTLWGPPGVGKTRLALRLAAEVKRSFADSTVFVRVRDAGSTPSVDALFRAVLGEDREDALGVAHVRDVLLDRPVLLVLDGCENRIDDVARLADALLERNPGLRILATSQHRIGGGSESLFPLAPFDTRHGQREPGGTQDALELFLDRARCVVPGFTAGDAGAEEIVAICRLVDGLPLAIEQAASRVRALPLSRIRDLTAESTLDLDATPGDRGPATLNSRLAAAARGCSPAELQLWARASVFDGFDLDSLSAVCHGEDLSSLELADLVTGLVDKSIFVRFASAGMTRFRMTTALREFGARLLAAGDEGAETRARYDEYFLRLALRARDDWFGTGQRTRFDLLQAEYANIVDVVERFSESETGRQRALRMLTALRHFWLMTGRGDDALGMLEAVLGSDDDPSVALQDGQWTAAYFCTLLGNLVRADVWLDAAERTAEVLAAPPHPYSDLLRALFAMTRYELDDAAELVENAHRASMRLDPEYHHGEVYYFWSIIAFARGDFETAERITTEAMQRLDRFESLWGQASIMWVMATIAWKRGDLDEALEVARDSLRIMRDSQDGTGAALCLELIAWVHLDRGRPEEAVRYLAPVYDKDLVAMNIVGWLREEQEKRMLALLGPDTFTTLFNRSAERPVAETIAAALGEDFEAVVDDARPTLLEPRPGIRLSARELEISALISEGYSNPRIAARLVISRRTVEGHVQRILNKCQFDSRTQIAVWYAQSTVS